MPIVTLPVEDGFATVSRFVANSVVNQLLKITGYKASDVIFSEDGAANNYSATTQHEAPPLQLDASDLAIVQYVERFSESNTDYRNALKEFQPVFAHSDLGIFLTPVHAKVDLEMTITLRFKSFDKANQWMNRWKLNQSIRDHHNHHNILYNYTVPSSFIGYLYDAHYLSEQVEPPGLTRKGFFETYFTQGIIARKNLSGSKSAIAVNTVQKNCLGTYTSPPEEITRERERSISEVQFTYKLTYERTTHMTLQWQPTIHNQRMPKIYFDLFKREDLPADNAQGPRQFSGSVNTATEQYVKGKLNITDVFFDPFDKWHPRKPLKDTLTLWIAPIQLDKQKPNEVLDLTVLQNHGLSDLILDVMRLLPECLTVAYGYPFYVEVFAVDSNTESLRTIVDPNLVVSVHDNIDMRLKQRHYLRISMLMDLSKLPPNTVDLLLTNVELTYELLKFWLPTIQLNGTGCSLKTVGTPGESNYRITYASWTKVLKCIGTTSEAYKRYYDFQAYLVQQTSIKVRTQ